VAAAIVPWLGHRGGAPAIGGPFALQDGAGRTVTDRAFRGRWMLVYFGYTHCPDACPTTLNDLATALATLPPASRARLAVVFITVDPDRDTPRLTAEYARAFDPGFVGLSGSSAAVAAAERAYHVYAARVPLKGGDYAMAHSSVIYVMDPRGRFAGVLPDNLPPHELAARIVRLIG
jgi:protein SCO1/2